MVLRLSNDDYNFEPLLYHTEKLIFENEQVSNWLLKELVAHFDDVHIVMAAYFQVCNNFKFSDYLHTLKEHMHQLSICINWNKINFYIGSIQSLLRSPKPQSSPVPSSRALSHGTWDATSACSKAKSYQSLEASASSRGARCDQIAQSSKTISKSKQNKA